MDEAHTTKDNVLVAIQVLYGGPPDQRNAASAWLNDFSMTSAAWHIALDMLSATNTVEVQFFASNMLLNKARRDWGRLQLTERAYLIATVRQAFQDRGHDRLSSQITSP